MQNNTLTKLHLKVLEAEANKETLYLLLGIPVGLIAIATAIFLIVISN